MKSMKRGLAVILAALLILPSLPVSAEEAVYSEEVAQSTAADEIMFNTGNHAWRVAEATVSGDEAGDAFFEEDGSYTINIPEENPFFPYEVQFTYNGEVTNQWFMTPEDTVEVGGHTFRVSAYFDDTAVTQMNLNVAGQKVVVYPEEKDFTNDEDGGISALSLLPLEEKRLTVDLTAFTPVELTMVSVDSIFTGESVYTDTSKIAWTYTSDDDYTVSMSGDKIDLSLNTYYSSSKRLEMIVGDGDQLNPDNIRYIINVNTSASIYWLAPAVYTQNSDGSRNNLRVVDSRSDYYDYNKNSRRQDIYVSSSELDSNTQAYVSLAVNDSTFAETAYDHIKVFEGQYTTAEEAEAGTEITGQILCADMTQKDAGYQVKRYNSKWITMVAYDENGNVTGCLPFRIYLGTTNNSINFSLYDRASENQSDYVQYSGSTRTTNGITDYTITTYSDYAADGIYYLIAYYSKDGISGSSNAAYVTAAYLGQYSTIAEATEAGAENIKDTLFNYSNGYAADYSQGVYFTIFIGEDGAEGQEIYRYHITTKQGTASKTSSSANALRSGTAVRFSGLIDNNGSSVKAYSVDYDEDSFGENNYRTIIVGEDVDLTKLAPVFTTSDGVNLYAAGSSSPEVSGKNYHDFSNGPVQYTASAENGADSANYWLSVVKAAEGAGQLYINSLTDDSADTRIENGVIYSTREVMLDNYHKNRHDIFIANMGTEAVKNLSVELVSDMVELDSYWTFSGSSDLEGYSTTEKTTAYGELPNLAKIRIRAKDDASNGAEVSGTLTIKSGDTALIVLKLTGMIGDPSIVTEEIPQAVKYVPYGTMIQNNNKYSWNKTSYELWGGTLPEGMVIKQNGELYGVPKETGDFTFTVLMRNSYSSFTSSSKTYTLTVAENTDANVEGATDTEYQLSQRVRNIDLDAIPSDSGERLEYLYSPSSCQTMVSQGEYAEFVAVYLDGVELTAGKDYTSESGSTRITIRTQALIGPLSNGTHTLGIEFRTQDTNTLKRAAQNYVIGHGIDTGDTDDNDGDDDYRDAGSDNIGSGNTAESANSSVTTIKYIVVSGDTLSKIAVKFYGSSAYWHKIFEDNSATIKNPDKICVGQTIIINLSSNTATAAPVGAKGKTYTVQPGDNLWKIAQKVYGNSMLWRNIYYANQGTISNPGRIYAGQNIIIPEN